MNMIEGAEKLDYIIKRYKDLGTVNKKELIDDVLEKCLGELIEQSDAYIKAINSFTNKEQFKINIYNNIYSLFYYYYRAEKVNDELVEQSLSTIFAILSESNKNIKAEREISEGYKYALDKLESTKWHKYPEDKPKKDGSYLITTIYSHIPEVISENYENGEFNLDDFVVAWAEKPMPYNEDENI